MLRHKAATALEQRTGWQKGTLEGNETGREITDLSVLKHFARRYKELERSARVLSNCTLNSLYFFRLLDYSDFCAIPTESETLVGGWKTFKHNSCTPQVPGIMASLSWLSPCARQQRDITGRPWVTAPAGSRASCTLHGTASGLTGQAEGNCMIFMSRC